MLDGTTRLSQDGDADPHAALPGLVRRVRDRARAVRGARSRTTSPLDVVCGLACGARHRSRRGDGARRGGSRARASWWSAPAGSGLATMMGARFRGRDHDHRRRPARRRKVEKALRARARDPRGRRVDDRPGGGGARAHRRAWRRLRLRRRGCRRHARPGDRGHPSRRDVRGHRPRDGRGRRHRRHHARCCASACSPAPTAGRSILAVTYPSSSTCSIARAASISA